MSNAGPAFFCLENCRPCGGPDRDRLAVSLPKEPLTAPASTAPTLYRVRIVTAETPGAP